MAPLLPNRLYRLAPLSQLQVAFRRIFRVHPLQLGGTSLSVDPKLGRTFKVDCTLLVSRLELLALFRDTCPVPSCTSFCQESFAVTVPFSLAPLPDFGTPLLSLIFCPLLVHGVSMVIASRLTSPNRSRFFVLGTAKFTLLPSRASGNLPTTTPYSPRAFMCNPVGSRSNAFLWVFFKYTTVANVPLGA